MLNDKPVSHDEPDEVKKDDLFDCVLF